MTAEFCAGSHDEASGMLPMRQSRLLRTAHVIFLRTHETETIYETYMNPLHSSYQYAADLSTYVTISCSYAAATMRSATAT
jgi:hypothetical protein